MFILETTISISILVAILQLENAKLRDNLPKITKLERGRARILNRTPSEYEMCILKHYHICSYLQTRGLLVI